MTNRQQQVQALEAYNLTFIRLLPGEKRPKENNWTSLPLGNVSQLDLYGSYYNLGVLAGREINKNEFLLILDIDPRNGGSIESIEKAVGTLPDTLTIKTASGGWHYYFVSETALPKCADVLPGVDILGVGSQAVAAGSKLKDGRIYEISNNPGYIEKTPTALERLISNHKKNEKKKPNPITTIKSGRNNYLTSIAGKLRASGLDEDAIYHALLAIDLKQCEPPLQSDDDETPPGLKQIEAIARSISRKNFDPIDVEAASIERFKPNEKEKPEIKKPEAEINLTKEFKTILDKTEGIVGELARQILKTADKQYPQFALASSFSILSSVAQGSYIPGVIGKPSIGKGNLSLYQTILAPAAGGKDSYIRAPQAYLKEIDHRMVAKKFGSVQGMQGAFYAFNSLTSYIDEMQDFFKSINSTNSQGFMAAIATMQKELYNGLEKLEASQTKGKVLPEINNPKYSIFSAGTTGGFIENIRDDVVNGGLQSRYIIWPYHKLVRKKAVDNLTPDPKIVKRLQELLRRGYAAGFDLEYFEQEAKYNKIADARFKPVEGEDYTHQPAVKPKNVIHYNREAEKLLEDFRFEQESKFLTSNGSGGDDSDMSSGSIYDRSSYTAIKFACLHALGRGETMVGKIDAEIGIALASLLAEYLAGVVEVNASGSVLVAKTIGVLKGQKVPIAVYDIWKGGCRKFKISEVHEAVMGLVEANYIKVVDLNGMVEEIDCTSRKKLPRGYKVYLK